jgi:hypothetical protein
MRKRHARPARKETSCRARRFTQGDWHTNYMLWYNYSVFELRFVEAHRYIVYIVERDVFGPSTVRPVNAFGPRAKLRRENHPI